MYVSVHHSVVIGKIMISILDHGVAVEVED
jgi:hypothetical protein